MANRDDRDDLGTWLHDRIEPLPPPPGTFEAIRRRARRRKYRKFAVTAGAAVVVVAAAVTVPQVVNLPVERGTPVAGQTSENGRTQVSPTGTFGVEASATAPITLPAGNPVPPNFQPSSLTAVSPTRVFTIGQAGTPGSCATQYCTSVARTENGGQTWNGLPAPLTGAPDGPTGVGQIRFLEGINGWAFGPELWATHDGGEHWHRVATHGQRVIDVEAVGARAFAIEATCTGTGTAFASACTKFTLYATPARSDDWTKVGAATTGLTPPPGQSTGAAALVLTGARGYLLGPDGTVYAGPVNGSAQWNAVGDIPCDTGQPQTDGEPAGALLGALTATNLLLACTQPPSGTTQVKLIYTSGNGGKTWQMVSTALAAGAATSIAASPVNTVVLATRAGIEVLPAGGTWGQAALTGAAPAGGFSFVGMTTNMRGMALPADPASGTVWFTTDGGTTWSPSPVK
jgi:photosystem II stability/assembly factor-like uncharacterized protein